MSTNRIDSTFARLRAENKKAFVGYICGGDPSLEKTPELVLAMKRAGVDIVELGVPFSDPLADGLVNQLAAARALEAGASLPGLLGTIQKIRQQSEVPIVLFSYFNPILQYGLDRFGRDAEAVGVDGLLLLDLPTEEEELDRALAASGNLKRICLIAPTSPPDRVAAIAARSSGFIYYVSREGVTGMQSTVSNTIADRLKLIREHSSVPICVGFGISTPEQARQVAESADGVVVGSALVNQIAEHGKSADMAERVAAFAKPLADAIHGGK